MHKHWWKDKNYFEAQIGSNIIHIILDLVLVLYGRFAPINLTILVLSSIFVSVIITHYTYVISKGGSILNIFRRH